MARLSTRAQLRIPGGPAAAGRLNKQIAFDIGVTEATVKSHRTAIFKKLGVTNRTQAVLAIKSLMEEAAPAALLRRPLFRRYGEGRTEKVRSTAGCSGLLEHRDPRRSGRWASTCSLVSAW